METVSFVPEYSRRWAEDLAGRLVCIKTFGCTYNEGDSEKIREVLKMYHCKFTDDTAEAEAVILNTCIVIAKTERKMMRLLHDLKGRLLFVTGCLPTARGDLLPPGTQIISPDDIHDRYDLVRTESFSSIGIVQVATGCVGTCRYCITRKARGYIRSVPEGEILEQIRRKVKYGAVEIRLTGQDVSAYGLDWGSPQLPSLLHSIGKIPGDFKVRVGMMNPATVLPILPELVNSFAHDRLFAFLHLPVQSGSDQVLKDMGRGYTVQDIRRIIASFREKYPDISLSTDIIVGFPRETDSDFSMSCQLIREISPESVNITRYSYRPGSLLTPDDDLLDRVKKERSRKIIGISHQVLQESKKKRIGTRMPVLVTEKIRSGSVTARSEAYQNVLISEDIQPGEQFSVRITGERIHYLIGERISGT